MLWRLDRHQRVNKRRAFLGANPRMPSMWARSSIGRAPVCKTARCLSKSGRVHQLNKGPSPGANRFGARSAHGVNRNANATSLSACPTRKTRIQGHAVLVTTATLENSGTSLSAVFGAGAVIPAIPLSVNRTLNSRERRCFLSPTRRRMLSNGFLNVARFGAQNGLLASIAIRLCACSKQQEGSEP